MKKKPLIAISVVILVLIAVLIGVVIANRDSTPNNGLSINPGTETKVTDLESTSTTVAVVGTIKCLDPAGASATQASSCAVGLQQDDGSNYALKAEDPTTTGSIPTGQRVEVNGVVKNQPTQFDADGVIEVKAIKQL